MSDVDGEDGLCRVTSAEPNTSVLEERESPLVLVSEDSENSFTTIRITGARIQVFDGLYTLQGTANDRPHWRSSTDMHLYWGPQNMWLLRSRFAPEDPTASGFLDEEHLPLGRSEWNWSSGGNWIGAELTISQHTAERNVSALQVVSCPVEAYTGFYTYVDEVNGHGHWATETGMHLYWGPQGSTWLLRGKCEPGEGGVDPFTHYGQCLVTAQQHCQ